MSFFQPPAETQLGIKVLKFELLSERSTTKNTDDVDVLAQWKLDNLPVDDSGNTIGIVVLQGSVETLAKVSNGATTYRFGLFESKDGVIWSASSTDFGGGIGSYNQRTVPKNAIGMLSGSAGSTGFLTIGSRLDAAGTTGFLKNAKFLFIVIIPLGASISRIV